MTTRQQEPLRLLPDDFIALRSLALSPWQQGEMLNWMSNGQWCLVAYSDVPTAKHAASNLVITGLAEDGWCECGCGRAIFRLTDEGAAFVAQMNEQ